MSKMIPLMIRMSFSRRVGRGVLLAFFSIAVVVLYGCTKEEPAQLPEVRVRLTIHLNLPQYSELQAPGCVVYIPSYGYEGNGIYVVHEVVNPGTYSAYDATCVRHLERPLKTVREGNVAQCPFCQVEYLLIDRGYTADGNYHLQAYRCTREGDILYISN